MAHFEVWISGEGLAEINGEPLVLEPGQSVHEAVLDRLQQYAEQRAAAVGATVNDGPGESHFVLEVSPDGSSRVLDPTDPAHRAPEPTPPPAPAPVPAPAPAPAPVPAPVPAPIPAPASAIALAVARARAAATAPPAPAPTPAPAPAPAPPSPPPSRSLPTELAEQITRINALATTGRLEEASAEATALRERLTSSAGTEHPDALEARAMEAYLAHLRGDHREATVLALSVARILCGAGDPQAPAAVARAAAAWQRLEDDRAAEIHGNELLHMWNRLHSSGRLSAADEQLAHQVRTQLEALSTYV
ncbi:hypothetical protein [Streptomyces sp. NPDC058625]|uniref:hypothetical protein n=1 Tax=Streptomyces sp. NPDC058625 TaxID=3346564 RepID=UPI0036657C08